MSDDLWERLCAMPRPHKVVDFPRKDEKGEPIGQLAMWVLTQSEQEESAAQADKRARALMRTDKGEVPKDDEAKRGYNDLYANAAADEILYRACRKVGKLNEAFFPSPALMRSKLSVDEVGVLMSHYYTVQEELGPIVAHMSKEETDALVARIEKSGERFPLDLLSPGALRTLVISLVRHRASSSTDTSSPGEPQDSGSSDTPSPSEAAEGS